MYEWISVEDRLPGNEQVVLVCAEVRVAGRKPVRVVVPAFRTDGTTIDEDSAYCWDLSCVDAAYDEDRDAYVIPEGWWESVRYAEEFAAVGDFVTHWMPLPEPPKEGMDRENQNAGGRSA